MILTFCRKRFSKLRNRVDTTALAISNLVKDFEAGRPTNKGLLRTSIDAIQKLSPKCRSKMLLAEAVLRQEEQVSARLAEIEQEKQNQCDEVSVIVFKSILTVLDC